MDYFATQWLSSTSLTAGRCFALKELRIQHRGRPLRAFFAFDPLRQAVVLCAGDKTGNDKRFYKEMVPMAERIKAKAQAIQAQINLVNIRKEQKISQKALAERLHVSQSNVSQMEGRGDIQLSALIQYAHALGATLNIELVMPDGVHRSLLGGV